MPNGTPTPSPTPYGMQMQVGTEPGISMRQVLEAACALILFGATSVTGYTLLQGVSLERRLSVTEATLAERTQTLRAMSGTIDVNTNRLTALETYRMGAEKNAEQRFEAIAVAMNGLSKDVKELNGTMARMVALVEGRERKAAEQR